MPQLEEDVTTLGMDTEVLGGGGGGGRGGGEEVR